MANDTGATGSQVTPPAAPGPAPKTPPADSGDQQYVTREEYQAQSNVIGGLRNEVKALLKRLETPVAKIEEPGTMREELEKIKAGLREREEAVTKRDRQSAIMSAIVSAGVDADGAKDLYSIITDQHGEQIKIEGQNVYHENEIGQKKPVKDFVADFLRGPRGERFRPPPATNSLPRGSQAPASGTKRYSEMSPEEKSKFSGPEKWALAQAEINSGV